MNVWVYYLYWSNKYPVGPDDPICRVATMKRNQTEIDEEKFPVVPDENKRWILKFSPLNLITCILQFSCLPARISARDPSVEKFNSNDYEC